jgi:hypothetical protein
MEDSGTITELATEAQIIAGTKTFVQYEQLFMSVNPYKDDTPATIMREVQIPDITWNPAFTTQDIDPLYSLINASPTHQRILGTYLIGGTLTGMYRYMRCDIMIKLKLNSTPYHQGLLAFGWLPAGAQDAHWQDPYHAASNTAILLSASSQDQGTIVIPYISPRPHYDLLTASTMHEPKAYLTVINAIKTSNECVLDSVPIMIWISLANVRLYGPMPQTDVGPPISKKSPFTFKKQASSQNKFTENKEAEKKDILGQSVKGIVSLVEPVLENIPIVSDIIRIGKNIFSNLDKPSTDQTTTFVTNRHQRGHTLLSGVDYCEPLSSFPKFDVARDIGLMSSDMLVTDYAKIPALIYRATITDKGIPFNLSMHPMRYFTAGQREQPDFLAFATSFFRFWRGSIKILLQFIGTPFYSARFRITASHGTGAPVSIGSGDCFYSQVVDIKGDHLTAITIPYLTTHVWSYVNPELAVVSDFSYLTVEALCDVQGCSLPADALYYLNVYRAAGNDYQLSQLGRSKYIEPPPVFTKQASLKKLFTEEFPGINLGSSGMTEHGLFHADTASTISDTCKRFTEFHEFGTGLGYMIPLPGTAGVLSPFICWQWGFLYWRGSRRLKICDDTNIEAIMLEDPDGESGLDGYGASINHEPKVTASIPWYSKESYYYTLASSYAPVIPYPATVELTAAISADVVTNRRYIAAGDDFVYLFPIQPLVNSLFVPAQGIVKSERKKDVIKPNFTSHLSQLNNTTKSPKLV